MKVLFFTAIMKPHEVNTSVSVSALCFNALKDIRLEPT